MNHHPLHDVKRQSRLWRMAKVILGTLVVYAAAAYLIAPDAWKHYERHRRSFDDDPRITETADGHPGDPINVALIGTEDEIKKIMQAADWFAADPLGVKSDLRIGADAILSRSYDDAPVSNLFLFGRPEDLAFEHPVGDNPRHRHHVRFWRSDRLDDSGRPFWLGSASYDKGVGLSHTTGQVTHHIAADVDTERANVMQCLEQTGRLSETYKVPGFHKTHSGRNGGGDPWHTDGDLWVGVIAANR